MESKPPQQNAPRKLKFKPKAPPRREPKPEVKAEKVDDVDTIQAMNLMRQFQERSMKAKPKVEKKVQASEIAFGFGAASPFLKSYGIPKGRTASNRDQGSTITGGAYNSGTREKEYVEPWNYYDYYPVTLPLRLPYSGNPAILDEEEFGEASATISYDETLINHAAELGLMEENLEASMFFLQLPPNLPMTKRSATSDGPKTKENQGPTEGVCAAQNPCRLDELPAGFMGKMLVYKSGAVKLKLGDTLYDVSPGMNCQFAQDVVAVNTAEKHCCAIAEINKRATLIPSIDATIDSFNNM